MSSFSRGLPRLGRLPVSRLHWASQTQRACFSADRGEGVFMAIDKSGQLASKKIECYFGEPHNSFCLIPPEIGRAFRHGNVLQGGLSLGGDPGEHSIAYYHETRHYAHPSHPYPRLVIPKSLPSPTNSSMSAATLWLDGVSHAITLDGTEDADFQRMARDSYRELKPALDRLKDS